MAATISQAELQRLISLTFDEKPEVRKQAALALSEIDDPAALFALLELSYDKKDDVRKTVRELLQQKKTTNQEMISLAEIFSYGSKKKAAVEESAPVENEEVKRNKIISPITSLFEKRLGKERAELMKKKMMPTIEKVYANAVSGKPASREESGKKVMQEFITAYLEALSDIETMTGEKITEMAQQHNTIQSKELLSEAALMPEKPQEIVHNIDMALESVGTKEKEVEGIPQELEEIERRDAQERKEERFYEEEVQQTIFKKAYDVMLASGGSEEVMKKERERMLKELERDVNLAFGMAKKHFKELKITHLTEIKSGMRNVNTDELTVKTVEHMEYPKTKKEKSTFTRVIVNDNEGNEGVIYLFDGRGAWLKNGMQLKVVKGFVKTFDFSNETALTVSKRGSVYVVL